MNPATSNNQKFFVSFFQKRKRFLFEKKNKELLSVWT